MERRKKIDGMKKEDGWKEGRRLMSKENRWTERR